MMDVFKGLLNCKVLVTQSCPTLWDSTDCSPPGKNTGVGCHSLLQGDLPNPGIEPRSPVLEADALTSEPPGKPRLFKYDLNQIPYDYTVEVRNRFKGLDLIEYLKNYGQRFMTLYRRQGSRPSPRKRNAKRQNGCLRRPYT